MKKRALCAVVFMLAACSHAALVINGDMTSNSYATGGNHTYFQDVDQGWAVKSTSGLSLSANPGKMTWNGSTASLLADGLTQVNSVTTESGSMLYLTFDWTPAAASTNTVLEYQVIGWKQTTLPTATSEMFRFINGPTKGVSGLSGHADAVDLLTGTNHGSGSSTPSFATFTGSAGTTASAAISIDLSGYGAGLNDVSNYTYIGLRFHIAGNHSGLTATGSTLDNVALSTTAPTNPPPPILPLTSLETGWTIQKVRTAKAGTGSLIIGSTYEGALIGFDWNGTALWTNTLSGYMNHDLWCDDLSNDGTDEILIANADGHVYCVNAATGSNLWNFIPNAGGHLPPMYTVCTVHSGSTPYVVCGAYDKYIYYLDTTGNLVKSIYSGTYSISNPWGSNAPPDGLHNATFVRPFMSNGAEKLAVHGSANAMQMNGELYLFDPLADLPYATIDVGGPKVFGDMRIIDPDGDGNDEILMGSSGLNNDQIMLLHPATGVQDHWTLTGNKGPTGYRVTQTAIYPDGGSYKYFVLCGATLLIGTPSGDSNIVSTASNHQCAYAFNDMWQDPDSGIILLASAQSGGSCIHLIDTRDANWITDFETLQPPGKIAAILANTSNVWNRLATFSKPAWERNPVEVVLTSASPTHPVALDIQANYSSPIFLNYYWDSFAQDPLDWNRATVLSNNPVYRDKRDGRRSYTKTQSWILGQVGAENDGGVGMAMWGGHGNDPYYYSLDTLKGIVDLSHGEKTVLIWPEMNGSSTEFEMVMNDRFYPLADYMRTNNANIFIRNKNIFWQGAVYLPAWERMRNGEYAEVFTSGLEETSDKTQELSIVGRMGLWASGALDSWGMRCSRDNPSFDRQRQHSYQRLPNHFLRNMVYNLAAGASFLNVTYVDTDYQSLAWKLVATGALYVPKREEIVSFNPVHLAMVNPDPHYLDDGENNKWTTFYDQTFEQNNPFVFSHMNGTWPAAPNTEWDFSRYAAGVKDRRQNFLPPYPNGLVLITPPQEGVYANTNAPRGQMADHLHPMYKNILQEFISNGRSYISADGSVTNAADTYAATVSNAIAAAAAKLPLTVDGEVAWVCAQTSPTNLRLTVVDSGYLNPKARTATVSFHTVTPVAVTDVLDGTVFPMAGNSVSIDVPLGLWRFIDIRLSEPFFPKNGWGDYASGKGLTGRSTADFDHDGESDLQEYALGGDAADPAVQATKPTLSFPAGNGVSFSNLEVAHTNPGISYVAEWTDNLVSNHWKNQWDAVVPGPAALPGMNHVEHQLNNPGSPAFFRLRITQP